MTNRENNPLPTNDIECPRCGERVYAEVLVCPNCGLHLYAEDVEEEPAVSRGGVWNDVGAVLAGVVALSVVAFMMHRLAGLFPAAGASVVLWAAAPFAGIVGGVLAGQLAGSQAAQRGWLYGLVVGVLGLAPAYLLEAYWSDLSAQGPGFAALASWVVMVGCAVTSSWLGARPVWAQNHSEPRPKPSEKDLYFELLAYVRHDIDTAERLIDYERQRKPTASRAALIRTAIERLQRERS